MTTDFKPSQVVLRIPPLCDTYRRSEIEHAIALVVFTCAATGDTWRGVPWSEIQDALRAAVENKTEPMCSLIRNPFFCPDIHAAIRAGHAKWDAEPDSGPVSLTPAAIEALRKWVPGG